jgi:hypothetical protein
VIAGTYWLSLLRLRQVETFRVWLEAAGLALIYLLGMPLLMGSGGYALQALHLLDPSTGNNPAVFLTLFGEVPALLLFAVLLTLVTSGMALGFAVKFADWHDVRYADLPGRGWLDFLMLTEAFLTKESHNSYMDLLLIYGVHTCSSRRWRKQTNWS